MRYNFSFNKLIVIAFLAAAIVMSVTTTLVFSNIVEEQLLQSEKENVIRNVNVWSSILREELIRGYYKKANSLCEDFLKTDGVALLSIKDSSGESIFEKTNQGLGRAVEAHKHWFLESSQGDSKVSLQDDHLLLNKKLYFSPTDESSQALATIQMIVDLDYVYQMIARTRALLLWTIMAAIFAQLILIVLISGKLTKPIKYLTDIVSSYDPSKKGNPLKKSDSDKLLGSEIKKLHKAFADMFNLIERYKEKDKEMREIKIKNQIASQVVHDLRSPLSALAVAIKDLSEVPLEKRGFIDSAVQRIIDITNDLARRNKIKAKAQDQNEKFEVCLISPLIEELISEKRMQYRNRSNLHIGANFESDTFALFSKIQPTGFKRVLSNLIDNSVEAIKDRGNVSIKLSSQSNRITVIVSDNGCGIAPDIQPKLMQKGASFNKSNGTGLGLHHAKKTVESWGGSINLESKLHEYCKVTLSLFKHEPPKWFLPEIVIAKDTEILILDDDPSIFELWNDRFRSKGIERTRYRGFTTPDGLLSWCREHLDENDTWLKNKIFLIDYDLMDANFSGLNIIDCLKIQKQSILVTSQYEEKDIVRHCLQQNIKILPKNLAGSVPITKDFPKIKKNRLEYALVDDDEFVRKTWENVAKKLGKKVRVFENADTFFSKIEEMDFDTKIYLDSDLGPGVRGEEIAKKVKDIGFKYIYLATGKNRSEFQEMPWITDIVKKKPPFLVKREAS